MAEKDSSIQAIVVCFVMKMAILYHLTITGQSW